MHTGLGRMTAASGADRQTVGRGEEKSHHGLFRNNFELFGNEEMTSGGRLKVSCYMSVIGRHLSRYIMLGGAILMYDQDCRCWFQILSLAGRISSFTV